MSARMAKADLSRANTQSDGWWWQANAQKQAINSALEDKHQQKPSYTTCRKINLKIKRHKESEDGGEQEHEGNCHKAGESKAI